MLITIGFKGLSKVSFLVFRSLVRFLSIVLAK